MQDTFDERYCCRTSPSLDVFDLAIPLLFFHRLIDEEALEQALSAAVTCTILAAAGPQRSRVLATLYKVIPAHDAFTYCNLLWWSFLSFYIADTLGYLV